MGLLIYVCRSTLGDSTNGGVSSKYDTLTCVNMEGPSEPSSDAPAVLIQEHVRGCLRLVVARKNKKGEWEPDPFNPMFGGNYAATSDARFHKKCEQLLGHTFYGAVAIHDRLEW